MRMASDFKQFIAVPKAWLLAAALLLYGAGVGILAPMNAIYLRESLGLSKSEIASIFAAALLLNMALTIGAGLLSDRLQRKKPLPLAAAAACGLGVLLYMRADGYASALAGMALATAPSGMIMGQLFAMARNHFALRAPDIVEIAQLWLRTAYSVGFFGGLLLGANIYLAATFQGVLWGNFAGFAALFALLAVYREVDAPAAARSAARGEPFSWLALIALLLLSCADAIRGLYLPLVVHAKFHNPALMSYLWSAQAVFELLFMTLAGYGAAKYGSKRVIAASSFLALATYIVYATVDALPVFFAVQPLYSFFVSVLYGVAMGMVQRMFVQRTGFGTSLYVFIAQTASLTGYLMPLFVEGLTPNIFYIPAAMVVLSIVLILRALRLERPALPRTPEGQRLM